MNTLYLPELREMLAEGDDQGLREFCTTLHPARLAEFMEGLSGEEAWQVLSHADEDVRVEIFSFFEHQKQIEIIESQPREEIAALVAQLPADDRVDMLKEADDAVVEEVLPLVPTEERRDIQRLLKYPEGTAGSVMTSEFAKLSETLTVRQAIEELSRQIEDLETMYYLYIVDDNDHLRGIVSFRAMVSSIARRGDTTLGELMDTEIVSVNVADDQEEVANKVARYDLLAIPVVDDEHHMVGIITHDDIIDVMREEATEDAHRIAAVDPLEVGYLRTGLLTLSWKRGIWLIVLFVGALLTALALDQYEERFDKLTWLVLFIPLVISSGGNSGSQSATLIITGLSTGDIRMADWVKVVWREILMGLVLGGGLGLIGFLAAYAILQNASEPVADPVRSALVIPLTLLLVVVCGTLTGSLLPLVFKRSGLDPALMSNPFVAGIIDIAGIVIYMNVAMLLLPELGGL